MEPLVSDSLLGCQPVVWIVCEEFAEEVVTCGLPQTAGLAPIVQPV